MREFYRIFCIVCAFAPCVSWADLLSNGPVAFPPAPVAPVAPVVAFPSSPGNLAAPTSFPKTAADLNNEDRIALLTAGYEPYKDLESYPELILESEQEFLDREYALLEHEREEDLETMDQDEYCELYPFDEENCPQIPGLWDEIIAEMQEETVNDNTPALTGAICTEKTIGGNPVIANNHVVCGSCCAAAKSNHYKNIIYTTTRYDKTSPAFAKAMITLFRKEGRCGEIKNDPCGFTCYGIGEKCLGKTAGLNRARLSRLSRAEAEDIYYKYIWEKYKIGSLPDVISPDIFLAVVGSGQSALGNFRTFLGLPASYGAIDSTVVDAVKNYRGDIHNRWINARKQRLIAIFNKNQQKPEGQRYNRSVLTSWLHGIDLKRENGCHVVPREPLYR